MIVAHLRKPPSISKFNQLRALSSANKSQSNLVLVDVDDKTGYALVSLNRAPVNSFNLDLCVAFNKALDEVAKNKSKGLILTSTIPKIFSVGFDVRELYKPDPQRIRELWRNAHECWAKLYGSFYPSAAATNGHSPAAGCFFAMSCEYRVMVTGSKIGLSGARLGISMPHPIIMTMSSILSSRQTELAILSGTLFSTEEAFKVGLIDEIAKDKSDAIMKCEEFLNRFMKIPPNARGNTKQLMRQKDIQEIMKNKEKDIEDFVTSMTSDEAQRAFEIFLDPSKKKDL